MMSAIVKTLKDWWAARQDGDEAVIVDIAITTIEKLEKYKANAEPRIASMYNISQSTVGNIIHGHRGYANVQRS